MNARFITVLGRVLPGAVVVAMWFQIRNLEKQVSLLTRAAARPQVYPVGRQTPIEVPDSQKSIFKLIGSPRADTPSQHADMPTDPKTPIGVPWDVERAMMGSASEGMLPRQQPSTSDPKLSVPPAEMNSK